MLWCSVNSAGLNVRVPAAACISKQRGPATVLKTFTSLTLLHPLENHLLFQDSLQLPPKKMSSFLFPDSLAHSLLSSPLLLCLGLTVIWCQAGSSGTADGRNQTAFLHHSTRSLQCMGHMPGIRSGNYFYFLQLLKIIFQLNRSPNLVHRMALKTAGSEGTVRTQC